MVPFWRTASIDAGYYLWHNSAHHLCQSEDIWDFQETMEGIKVGLMLEYSCWIATEASAFLHLIILCEKCGKRRQRNIIISYWLLFSVVSVLGISKFQLDEGLSNFLWSHRGQKQWWCYDTEMWVLCSQVLSCQHPLCPARNWQKKLTQLKCSFFPDADLVTILTDTTDGWLLLE